MPALFVLTIILFLKNKNILPDLLITLKHQKLIFAGLLFAAVISVVARPGTGDIADYHLQAIICANKYPNILGLGNFNRPLANNNWWFNLQSVFGINSISLYALNAVLFISTMLFLVTDNTNNIFINALKYPLLLFVATSTKTAFVGSVTPDYAVTLLIFISVYVFAKCWFNPNKTDVTILLILAAFATTIKLNAVVLIPFCLLAYGKLYKTNRFANAILIPIVVFGIFIIPWLIGNVIVSGWLAYPINIIDLFNVDWKVPEDVLTYERFSIKQWGKIPGNNIHQTATLSFAVWFPVWFSNNDVFNKVLITALPLLTIMAFFFTGKENKNIFLILAGFGLFGLLFCFSNGPHIRYAYGYIFMTLSASFAILYVKFVNTNLRVLGLAFVFITLIPIAIKIYALQQNKKLHLSLIKPLPYPKSTALPQILNSQLIYISAENNNCWDLFPCSYYKIDGCTLRGKTLNEGFKVSSN